MLTHLVSFSASYPSVCVIIFLLLQKSVVNVPLTRVNEKRVIFMARLGIWD